MRAIFGGVIAAVLLGIYVHLLAVAYLIVDCVSRGCTTRGPGQFGTAMAQSLSVVSGLVSALVIAELAVSKPGEPPATRVLADGASQSARTWLKWVSIAYVLIWLVAGFATFMKSMYHPEVLPAFTSIGQAWLGLAIASAYAYFGIQPQK